MPKAKLTTKSQIDALPHPTKGQVLYWCTDLRGFGVCVGIRSKTFCVQRDVKGRSRRITIGRYGDISLHAARKQAEQLAGTMRGGTDPVKETREATADNMTLREAWELYEGHLKAKKRSPRTRDGYWKSINRYCKDWLDRPLVEITPKAARDCHERISKKGEFAANATMRALRAIWRRAQRQHRGLGDPPTVNVDFHVEKPRTAVVKVEALPAWWRGVQAIENPIRRDFYIWLLFTGCRRGESETLRWEQIDFDAGSVHFPLTKTDPFDLPLSDYLRKLLKSRRECVRTRKVHGPENPWVFPAHGKRGHLSEPQLSEKEGQLFPCSWSPHTLRHTWNTISQNKIPMPAAHSRLLQNHTLNTKGDAHMGYNHPDLEDLRKSQQLMTDFLLSAIHRKPSGGVVPIRRR